VVFGWKPGDDPLSRDYLWTMFMDPSRRALAGDWDHASRVVVAKFRADSARNIDDPACVELISTLRCSSPEFRKLWNRHEVLGGGEGRKELVHPVVGRLVFDHAVFRHAELTEQRLVLYTPVSDEHETRAKLAQLLELAPAPVA